MAKKKIIRKLKNKYRFIIYNDRTFAEIFSLRLSLFNSYVIFVGGALLFIILGILLVTSTPLKRILPNSEYQIKQKLYKNAIILDSLQLALNAQEKQYKRIYYILNGQDSIMQNLSDTTKRTSISPAQSQQEINYIKSKEDSLLREVIEAEDRFNITRGKASKKEQFLNLYLYPPINNGVVVAEYQKSSLEYYGVDIAAQEDTHVMATAGGTVISANWSVESGYTIIIQHESDLISSYKHNAKLLKRIGDKVERGEAIAILGDTGENTSGVYLHFELWYKGKSIDPQDFMSF